MSPSIGPGDHGAAYKSRGGVGRGAIMLIIKRRLGQSVVVGVEAEVVITVHEIHPHEISLIFDAPKTVPVDRLEVAPERRRQRAAKKKGASGK